MRLHSIRSEDSVENDGGLMREEIAREIELEEKRVHSRLFPNNMAAWLSEAASKYGDKVLFNFFDEGKSLTYSEMNRDADLVSQGLLRSGIKKGTHVGVMLPNIPEFPLLWFALAKIGAVIVPIN